MALTMFDCKGIPALWRNASNRAVIAGGLHRADLYEGWNATDPFRR